MKNFLERHGTIVLAVLLGIAAVVLVWWGLTNDSDDSSKPVSTPSSQSVMAPDAQQDTFNVGPKKEAVEDDNTGPSAFANQPAQQQAVEALAHKFLSEVSSSSGKLGDVTKDTVAGVALTTVQGLGSQHPYPGWKIGDTKSRVLNAGDDVTLTIPFGEKTASVEMDYSVFPEVNVTSRAWRVIDFHVN